MAHSVAQMLLVVFVTLFSLSKGSEHQCRDDNQDGTPYDGLICPSTEYDRQHNLTYCCQTTTEECCTKSDWETKNPDSNPDPLSLTPIIIGLCFGGVFVILAIAGFTRMIILHKRRSAVIRNSRRTPQTVVIGAANPCYDPTPRVGHDAAGRPVPPV